MQTPANTNNRGRRCSAAFATDINAGCNSESEAPTEIVWDDGTSRAEDLSHLLLPSSGEATHPAPSGEKVHLSFGSVVGDPKRRKKTTGGPTPPPASMASSNGTGRRSGRFTSSRLKRRREERRILLESALDASEHPPVDDDGDGGTRDVRDDGGNKVEEEVRSGRDDSPPRPRLTQAEADDIGELLNRAAHGHASPLFKRKISFDECGRSGQGTTPTQADGPAADQVFDDEVWSDADLAAIDRRVAVDMSNSGRPASASPPPAGTCVGSMLQGDATVGGRFSYDFDNDDEEWDELDLMNIDASVAVARGEARKAAAPLPAAPSRDTRTSVAGEFSDDDGAFEDIDLSALEGKIEEHRRQLAAQRAGASHATPRDPPPADAPVRNRRCPPLAAAAQKLQPLFLSFTRYVVKVVHDDLRTFTKSVAVALWESGGPAGDSDQSSPIDGYMHLRGTWYHTDCHPGDVVHLCSLSGEYMTDVAALPVVLHSSPPAGSDANDDLLLVIHPDDLISPTLISEAVTCPRLAVLQSRLGSTRLGAKSAVIGSLRHDLFQRCLRERDATPQSGALFTREILRRRAESLVGCGILDQKEAFSDVMAILPHVRSFLATYTSWDMPKRVSSQQPRGGNGSAAATTATIEGIVGSCDLDLVVRDLHSTEEWVHVPELGLKGSVDATVISQASAPDMLHDYPQEALMAIELKTGHSRDISHRHLAQLSTYTTMLRARHGSAHSTTSSAAASRGAAPGGMLLHLNRDNFAAKHIMPSLGEVKTLVGQRNSLACDIRRANGPRGITIQYEEHGPTPAMDKGQGGPDWRALDAVSPERLVIGEPRRSALPNLNGDVHACERCHKNRECMMYASSDNALPGDHRPSPALGRHKVLVRRVSGSLSNAHLEYFRKWDRLIDMEKHACSREAISKPWLCGSSEKEAADGKCISSLVVEGSEPPAVHSETDNDATVRFQRSEDCQHRTPLWELSFEVGSHVTVSEDGASFVRRPPRSGGGMAMHGLHLLRGIVTRIGATDIDVAVPQKDVHLLVRATGPGHPFRGSKGISVAEKKSTFRLDKDEYGDTCKLLHRNLVDFFVSDIPARSLGSAQSVVAFGETASADHRRRLVNSVVQLCPPPRFNHVSEQSIFAHCIQGIPGCDAASLKRDFDLLNVDQKAAVRKVLSARDFALIEGFPGTGKSATIALATRMLVAQGKRVLLTSYTHSAVDNILTKLMDGGVKPSSASTWSPVLRIARQASCSPTVRPILAETVACEAERNAPGDHSASSIGRPRVDYLEKVVTTAKVVGITALTAPRSPLLAGQHFDVVIVDEAGQMSQPAVLGAIMAADSFVLVGDHMQLPPLVVSDLALEAGYAVSMLMHLAQGFPDAVAKLTIQYRMNEAICVLPNIIAYDGLLKCGSDAVRHQRLNIRPTRALDILDRQWIDYAMDPDRPVIFLDTDRKGMLESNEPRSRAGGPTNNVEVNIVAKVAISLELSGVKNSDMGVITPFRSQLRLLSEEPSLHESMGDGLEVSTVDKFQGRDKPVITVSLVRSNKEGKAGMLLQDFRRLNVAFSRAKVKMILVGSYTTLLKGSHVLRPVLESMQERGWVHALPP